MKLTKSDVFAALDNKLIASERDYRMYYRHSTPRGYLIIKDNKLVASSGNTDEICKAWNKALGYTS